MLTTFFCVSSLNILWIVQYKKSTFKASKHIIYNYGMQICKCVITKLYKQEQGATQHLEKCKGGVTAYFLPEGPYFSPRPIPPFIVPLYEYKGREHLWIEGTAVNKPIMVQRVLIFLSKLSTPFLVKLNSLCIEGQIFTMTLVSSDCDWASFQIIWIWHQHLLEPCSTLWQYRVAG